MANITVKISEAEKKVMLKTIKASKGATISVAKLAREASQNPNRARFVIDELVDDGKIKRVVTKSFNARYIRYSYEVL